MECFKSGNFVEISNMHWQMCCCFHIVYLKIVEWIEKSANICHFPCKFFQFFFNLQAVDCTFQLYVEKNHSDA